MQQSERRRFPRINDDGFGLDVKAEGFDIVAHTLNISASGLCCKVSRALPLMARVNLKLMIPDASQSGSPKQGKSMDVNGVVVREHPVVIDGKTKHYDVAIFFDDLPEKHRDAINSYIANRNS
jgi:hypothetical protein